MGFLISNKLSNENSINFWTSLGHMLQSGNSLKNSVTIIYQDPKSKIPKKLLENILEELDMGSSLYLIVQKFEKCFGSGLWRQIQASEESGRLAEGMLRIAKQLKVTGSSVRKIRGALVYPVLMLIVGLLVGYWMITSMLPTMQETMGDLGGELPGYTLAVIDFCNWIQDNIVISLIIIACVIATILFLLQGPLKVQWHRFIFNAPLTGKISGDSNFARIYTLFVDMVSNGATEELALRVAAASSSNIFIEKDLMKCADVIARDGVSIATAFKDSQTIPSEDRLLLEIGAASGREGDILRDLAERRSEIAEETMSQLTELISPLSTLIVGGVVAFVVIVCYIPMMTMTYSIG